MSKDLHSFVSDICLTLTIVDFDARMAITKIVPKTDFFGFNNLLDFLE